jgi:hypothetical protein
MFLMVLNVLAWVFVIALAVLAFMFAGAALGALIGKTIVTVRRLVNLGLKAKGK